MIDALSLEAVFAVFGLAALVVVTGGVRMTALADRLTDRTGLGTGLVQARPG